MNDLSDLNLNNDLETLDLLDGADSLGCILHSYLWRSDASPKNLQVILNDVRTFIKFNYRNEWLEELGMMRKQKSTELSRTMLTQYSYQYIFQSTYLGASVFVSVYLAESIANSY